MTKQPGHESPKPKASATPSGDEKALQELRSLLFSEEQQEIVALRERLESPEQRTKDVGSVVAEAIELRRAQDGGRALSDALSPTVEGALRESVRKDSHILAEALFPVMGPAIRKSVAEAIRSMVQSFNQALEHAFSIQGLKWRLEAIRTGRPYAEVVLLRSLVYRVEQIFLIHKKTGLLLQHATAPAVAIQDPDMVSGMLSAIQDFVRDSFNAPQGESLDSLQVGELQVWVERGPEAILAAVIRGDAPWEFRVRLKEKVEEVHDRFGTELDRFEGNAAPFAAFHDELAKCTEARFREGQKSKPRPYFLAAVVILAGVLVGYMTLSKIEDRNWDRFVQSLGQQPGIVISSFAKEGGRYRIQGLRDPLAVDPAALLAASSLEPKRAEFQWHSYIALDDALVLKRARALLAPPPGVTLSVANGVLRVAGDPPPGWAKKMRERALLIPGIRMIDEKALEDADSLIREKAAVERAILFFDVGTSAIRPDQQTNLQQVANAVQALLRKAETLSEKVTIEVAGHTDSTGPETTNKLLSEERATQVVRGLEKTGVPAEDLRPKGLGTSEPLRPETSEEDRRYNRSVRFRVIPSPGPATR